MKSLIKLGLILPSLAFGNPIYLFHENNLEEANLYREILAENYRIPEALITVRSVKNCEEKKPDGKLDLCIKNNRDLYLISVDYVFVDESLKVFQGQ